MNATELLIAFANAGKRVHLIGDKEAGVIVALDMEGRLFTVIEGQVLNRVNPDAISEISSIKKYLNPGGDVLWPAPEGTMLGYQYSTGEWRVPPGIRSLRYMIDTFNKKEVIIKGDVDLINNKGLGIPTIFQRQIGIVTGKKSITVNVADSITYRGCIELQKENCLLAPWSLCQFDSGPDCEVVFPCSSKSSVWDLYDDSSISQRQWTKELCRTSTDGTMKYQIGLDKKVSWIRYYNHQYGLTVERTAKDISKEQSYIDIRDASPKILPSPKGVRFSVYSDPTDFMEIESVGGCPVSISPGTEVSLYTITHFSIK